ncbi:MAG: GntR family transcriptional regulator [Solobacterium sp.]|nr:GntR family transcriptional regulator [Solobacterium sp.]
MFLLDPTNKVPIYEQIQAQILRFIEAGILSPGDRLPSVRQLAQENGINPNTAARAYSMLEQAGCVYNLPKKGVYVAEVSAAASRNERIRSVLGTLKDSGCTKEEILQAVEQLYKEEDHAQN